MEKSQQELQVTRSLLAKGKPKSGVGSDQQPQKTEVEGGRWETVWEASESGECRSRSHKTQDQGLYVSKEGVPSFSGQLGNRGSNYQHGSQEKRDNPKVSWPDTSSNQDQQQAGTQIPFQEPILWKKLLTKMNFDQAPDKEATGA